MGCHDVVARLPHVAPSVSTVFCTLYGHEPMTGQDIRKATGLPRRTVYAALERLREIGILGERPSLRDTRQTYFWVNHLEKYVSVAEDSAAAAVAH